MTVRHLLGGVALAAVASLLAVGQASAQTITYTSVVNPPAGGLFTGSPGVLVTATPSGTTVNVSGPNNILLSNLVNGSTNPNGSNGFFGPTNYTITIGIKNNQNNQTVVHILQGNLTATNLDPTGGFFTNNFTTPSPIVYSYANGDSLTLSLFSFVAPGATTGIGQTGSIGAAVKFTSANVAPEPGSMALVATGLMSTLGMVAVRRRKAA